MEDIPTEITRYTDESLSQIHHTLRATRRRLLVGLLTYRTFTLSPHSDTLSETVAVRQLAREIVVIEEDIDFEHATGESYHNVYSSLIQSHLPELHDVGVIEYDSDRKEVTPAANLIAVATVAAITSPPAQFLYHRTVTECASESRSSVRDSTTD